METEVGTGEPEPLILPEAIRLLEEAIADCLEGDLRYEVEAFVEGYYKKYGKDTTRDTESD